MYIHICPDFKERARPSDCIDKFLTYAIARLMAPQASQAMYTTCTGLFKASSRLAACV